MKKSYFFLIALAVTFVLSVRAHATLTTIGTATYSSLDYNLIYDDDLGLTWLDYTNSLDFWQNQVDWAAGLNISGVLTYNLNPGVTVSWAGDWRLPTSDTCYGFNCTGSEMGHLYYTELGNVAMGSLANTGDFQNLVSSLHWSGTEDAAPYYMDDAWEFSFRYGFQSTDGKTDYDNYAIAVRPGGISAVPEPTTLLLLGSGLLGLGFVRRRFRG